MHISINHVLADSNDIASGVRVTDFRVKVEIAYVRLFEHVRGQKFCCNSWF